MAESVFAVPKGFKAAACSAGIKKSGKLDLALICADKPAECAGVFTTNKVVAAPVKITESRVRQGLCQAILVNSGNAHACTGYQGLKDARRCGYLVAEILDIPPEMVAVSSTGVIGVPLPMYCFEEHVPTLCRMLKPDQFDGVARAMMTTDAFPKMSGRTITIDGQEVRLLGLAKGAGMIHPDMATMLSFIVTDINIKHHSLQKALKSSVEKSFNMITIDGDTSTNDTVLILANGTAGNKEIEWGTPEFSKIQAMLDYVTQSLAKMIVKDGEGATKFVEIIVRGARHFKEAKKIVDEKAHELTGMESNKTDKSEPIIEGFDPIKGGQFQEMPSKSEKLSDEESKREKLEAIRSQLKEMVTTDTKNIDFNKLDGLLIELQEMGDENGTVGGVSIPQLRKIILQSNKILMREKDVTVK